MEEQPDSASFLKSCGVPAKVEPLTNNTLKELLKHKQTVFATPILQETLEN